MFPRALTYNANIYDEVASYSVLCMFKSSYSAFQWMLPPPPYRVQVLEITGPPDQKRLRFPAIKGSHWLQRV